MKAKSNFHICERNRTILNIVISVRGKINENKRNGFSFVFSDFDRFDCDFSPAFGFDFGRFSLLPNFKVRRKEKKENSLK